MFTNTSFVHPGVYFIHCDKNNRLYIGSTVKPIHKRLKSHLNSLRNSTHPNVHLLNAYNKYGEDCFYTTVHSYVFKQPYEQHKTFSNRVRAVEQSAIDSHGFSRLFNISRNAFGGGDPVSVSMLDYYTGAILKTFDSIVGASHFTDIPYTAIASALSVGNSYTRDNSGQKYGWIYSVDSAYIPFVNDTSITHKNILQFDPITLTIIAKYKTIADIVNKYNVNKVTIAKALNKKLSLGYLFVDELFYSTEAFSVLQTEVRNSLICSIDIETNTVVKLYISIKAASVDVNGIESSISKVLSGAYNTTAGYGWCRFGALSEYSVKQSERQQKVAQYGLDGILIRTFSTITEAANNTHINRTSISKSVGRTTKGGRPCTAGGFVWRHI